jgi:hypothetical protein
MTTGYADGSLRAVALIGRWNNGISDQYCRTDNTCCYVPGYRKGEEQGDMIELEPVFMLRYGLHGREVLTLYEIGPMKGLSKARVRQLQNEALGI